MPDMNPQPEAEGDDLRSSLEAQFTAAEAAAPAIESEAPVEQAPDEAPAADASVSVEAAGAKPDHPTDPARYADGTFKKTKSEAAPETAAPETIPSTDPAKASEQPAPTPALAPPAGWTAAEKAEVWPTLSPAAQAAVSRREAEMSRGGQQWSEQKRAYEGLLAPVAQAASRYGLSVDQGLNALLHAQRRLEEDAPAAIRELARQHGVNLATLAGQPAEGSSEQPPDISALVRQAVDPLLAPIREKMQAEEHQRQQSTVNLVSDFAAAPGHEHFEAVQEHVLSLIPTIKNMNPTWTNDKVLQEAYDQAVWANPTTRQAMTEAKQREQETARIAAAKKRASDARLAGSSLTGAPVGSNGAMPKGSIREELEAAWSGA